jgi:hypothetical protein
MDVAGKILRRWPFKKSGCDREMNLSGSEQGSTASSYKPNYMPMGSSLGYLLIKISLCMGIVMLASLYVSQWRIVLFKQKFISSCLQTRFQILYLPKLNNQGDYANETDPILFK